MFKVIWRCGAQSSVTFMNISSLASQSKYRKPSLCRMNNLQTWKSVNLQPGPYCQRFNSTKRFAFHETGATYKSHHLVTKKFSSTQSSWVFIHSEKVASSLNIKNPICSEPAKPNIVYFLSMTLTKWNFRRTQS